AGSVLAMFWLDARLAIVGLSMVPLSAWALSRVRAQLTARVRTLREASAAIGSFLIETLQAVRLVVTSNAQSREVDAFRRRNTAFVDALMSMQLWSYLSGSVPGLLLSLGYAAVFIYGGHRVIDGSLTLGTFVAFMAYQMRVLQPVQALMGLYTSLATSPSPICGGTSPSSIKSRSCFLRASPTTSATPARRRRPTRSARQRRPRASMRSSRGCPRGTRRSSASAARRCRRASGSAS